MGVVLGEEAELRRVSSAEKSECPSGLWVKIMAARMPPLAGARSGSEVEEVGSPDSGIIGELAERSLEMDEGDTGKEVDGATVDGEDAPQTLIFHFQVLSSSTSRLLLLCCPTALTSALFDSPPSS